VTSVDEMSKLKALRRARERLETALAADEGWQALLRSSATAGTEAGETGRLQARLLANPLYRAWTNVNAAIEARQRSGPIDATAPRPSTSSSDLDPSLARRQRNDDAVREAGSRGLAQSPPGEEEASVSFVALAPLPAPSDGRQPRRSALPAPTGLPARQGHEFPDSGATRGVEDWQGEEAEVSVVSVDARRHAGAVDRLLRALRGETNAG
jgi:hypothetical protein